MTDISVQDQVTEVLNRMSDRLKDVTKCRMVAYHIEQAWEEYSAIDLPDNADADVLNDQFFKAVVSIETVDLIDPDFYEAMEMKDCPQYVVFHHGRNCVVVVFQGGGFQFEAEVGDYKELMKLIAE